MRGQNLLSKFLMHGRSPPQLAGNGRGDRPESRQATPGAATSAWARPRLQPGLDQGRGNELLAILAEILNSMVRHRLRRLQSAAERRRDRQIRGEKQEQRKPPQRMRGKPPKLQLGTALQEHRTDILLIRGRAEAGGQEPSALPPRLFR